MIIKKKGSNAHNEFIERLSGDDSLFFTDTHAHIHFDPLAEDLDGVIERARQNKVGRIVTVGINMKDNADALKTAEKYDEVKAVVGVHPHDADDFDMADLSRLEDMLSHPEVIALGEIGLDFYRHHSSAARQEEVFTVLLDMAHSADKPVVIHNRDATDRTIEILDSVLPKKDGCGIIHCFSGDRDLLKFALDAGFYISYAGPVTYPKATELQDSLKYVPEDRILVETDCPYLTPSPYRGKVNEPANVVYTANYVSGALKMDINKISDILEMNFKRLFGEI